VFLGAGVAVQSSPCGLSSARDSISFQKRVGVGERAAQRIVADLVSEGFLVRIKEGRRNRYEVNRNAHLRHPLFADLEIGPLVDVLRERCR
jgi:DNA-binding transcriptional regulator PaaX